MRIQHISVPVNPHQSILLLFEPCKQLLFQRSGLPEKFLRLVVFSISKQLFVVTVVFLYRFIFFPASAECPVT